MNLIVHKRVFDEHYQVARHSELLLVNGKVERDGAVIHVLAAQFRRLALPSGDKLTARSRDFH